VINDELTVRIPTFEAFGQTSETFCHRVFIYIELGFHYDVSTITNIADKDIKR